MALSGGGDRADVVNREFIHVKKTVGTTAIVARVGSENLAGRQELVLVNMGDIDVYWGNSTVTITGSTQGVPIVSGGVANVQYGDRINVHIVCSASTGSAIIQEVS